MGLKITTVTIITYFILTFRYIPLLAGIRQNQQFFDINNQSIQHNEILYRKTKEIVCMLFCFHNVSGYSVNEILQVLITDDYS